MDEKNISFLLSDYVLDGVKQAVTPFRILQGISMYPAEEPAGVSRYAEVVDETSDSEPDSAQTDSRKVARYLNDVLSAERIFPLDFAKTYTKTQIARALLDCIWKMGTFRIGDLCLDAVWNWNSSQVGNMAAFYHSVEAAGEMLDSLNIRLREYTINDTNGPCSLSFKADIRPVGEDEDLVEQPYTSRDPRLGVTSIPAALLPDAASWIVYIPFVSSPYRLGGSLFSQAEGISFPVAPQLDDDDYFIDCYEVVRELVQDGIVLSGATVGEGGLISAVKRMAGPGTGAVVDLSDLKRASGESDIVRLLFAEIPGVLIQIRDIDFDYRDAELLLQDVAFYPIGHPVPGGNGTVRVHASAKTGIQNILDSLVQRQGGEGED